MKHQNTKFQYAQGGFGSIQIDLVKNTIFKKSRKPNDTSIMNEAEAYKLLYKQNTQSAHILQLISSSKDHLELERADCDLGFYSRNTKQNELFFLLVAFQCLEAILFIHSVGLVHCDIKPSNILLNFDTQGNFIVKICDFGLCHTIKMQKELVKGTSGYTDPRTVLQKLPLNQNSDLWSLAISLLIISTDYQHIDQLQTKTFKQQLKSSKMDSQQVEQYIQEVIPQLNIPDNCIGFIIKTLLSQNGEHTTEHVFNQILQDVKQKYPTIAEQLANIQFNDNQLLGNIPFIEYFKFLDDELYIYLVNRQLIITDDKDLIAIKDNNIFYSDPDFTQNNISTFKQYMQRFGFQLNHLKTKAIQVQKIYQVTQNNLGVISFQCDGMQYEIDPNTGNQIVQLKSGRKAFSCEQNRFVV